MSGSGIAGDPFAGGELPHDELVALARILNQHVTGFRTGGARTAAAAIMRAGWRLNAGDARYAGEVELDWPDPDARPTY